MRSPPDTARFPCFPYPRTTGQIETNLRVGALCGRNMHAKRLRISCYFTILFGACVCVFRREHTRFDDKLNPSKRLRWRRLKSLRIRDIYINMRILYMFYEHMSTASYWYLSILQDVRFMVYTDGRTGKRCPTIGSQFLVVRAKTDKHILTSHARSERKQTQTGIHADSISPPAIRQSYIRKRRTRARKFEMQSVWRVYTYNLYRYILAADAGHLLRCFATSATLEVVELRSLALRLGSMLCKRRRLDGWPGLSVASVVSSVYGICSDGQAAWWLDWKMLPKSMRRIQIFVDFIWSVRATTDKWTNGILLR